MNGCEIMKCTDYIDRVCHHDGECKYNIDEQTIIDQLTAERDKYKDLYNTTKAEMTKYAQEAGRLAAERDRYKAEMKYLAELLEDSNVTICKLCKRLNPQHENCTGCSDLKTRIAALAKIKEAGE